MWAYKLLIVLKAAIGNAEISSSSDLNCDFSSSCRWRNATNLEDNGDWIINNQYAADGTTFIIPREASDGYFAYTSSLIARSVALLISDVVNCQLGGANIKYWYFKTGSESQLEVCTRQPPGSKEFNSFKCYTGSTTNFAQQWIFRVIELPPLSQPFELVFRSTFYPPMDIVALSDIVYTSTLCEISNKGAQQGAGGSFQTEDSTAKLLKFNEGKVPVQTPPYRALNFAAPTADREYYNDQTFSHGRTSFTSSCPTLDCTFDNHTMCNYVTSVADSNTNATLRDWSISSKAVMNSLTGIPQDLSKYE